MFSWLTHTQNLCQLESPSPSSLIEQITYSIQLFFLSECVYACHCINMPFTAWKLFLMYPSCISESDCLPVCLQLLLYICTFFSFCLAVYIVFFRHSHFPLKCLRALRVQAINRSINRWLSDWLIDRFRWTDKWMDRQTDDELKERKYILQKKSFQKCFSPQHYLWVE